MTRASVIGVGMTPFGVHEATLPELFAEATSPRSTMGASTPTR